MQAHPEGRYGNQEPRPVPTAIRRHFCRHARSALHSDSRAGAYRSHRRYAQQNCSKALGRHNRSPQRFVCRPPQANLLQGKRQRQRDIPSRQPRRRNDSHHNKQQRHLPDNFFRNFKTQRCPHPVYRPRRRHSTRHMAVQKVRKRNLS